MKIKHVVCWLLVLAMTMILAGCNLPTQSNSSSSPDINATVAAEVAVQQAAQTMVAQTLGANAPAVQPSSTNTNTAQAPQETATASLTPTITLTPTPEGVFLTVSADTYCRQGGPYSSFKILGTLKVGDKAQVLARNPENDSYFIQSPYDASKCWVYGKYATLTGNSTALAVMTMQPTPTPTYTPTPDKNFTVSYVSLENCGGLFAFKLFIKNNGGLIWQSIAISGTDTVTSFAINHTSNEFKEFAGCMATVVQADLTPGEESYVLNVNPGHFAYDPTGHLINITVTLCTLDNSAGVCLSKPISFTP